MAPGRHSTLRTVSRKSFFVVVALATTATLFQIGELVAAEDYQDDQDVLHLCIFDQPNGSSTQAIWNPSADKYGYWTDSSQWLYDGGVPGWSEWVQIEGNLMDSSGDDDDDAGVAAMAYLDTEVDVGVLVMHNGGVTITNDSTGILNFVKNWSSSVTWCNSTRAEVTQFPTISPAPTSFPTHAPTSVPTDPRPTHVPSISPRPTTQKPTSKPTTPLPSVAPTAISPTPLPTFAPYKLAYYKSKLHLGG